MQTPMIYPTTRWCNSDDGTVVLNMSSGKYYSLNKTAAYIWSCLTEKLNPATVEQRLVEKYGVDRRQAADDIAKFLKAASSMGLVTDGRTSEHPF